MSMLGGGREREFQYMSALWMQTTAQANLCSSPPLRSSMFLSLTGPRSEGEWVEDAGDEGEWVEGAGDEDEWV